MSSKVKLPKSISLSSVRSPELKDMVMDDVAEASENLPHYFKGMTKYTLRIVNLQQFPDDFAQFLKENLVDEDMEDDLVQAHAVNWCRSVKKLYPLKTRGDGNCLLHAVSLAMWGIHDSSAFLRRLVLVSLVSDGQTGGGRLFNRWKRSRAHFNENALDGGITFDSNDWETEWQNVITAASDIKTSQAKRNSAMFDFLEDIHVFALANILRRPIIILSDSHVRSFSGAAFCANQFSGIYLPLLWSHTLCVKSPVILGYANNHFTPLVGMEEESDKTKDLTLNVVPLVTKDIESLKIHFLTQEDEQNVYKILKRYVNITEINWTRSDASVQFLPCAKLNYIKLETYDLMRDFVSYLQRVFREQKNKKDNSWLNWNEEMEEVDPTKQKSLDTTHKSLDLQLVEHERERDTQLRTDIFLDENHEEKILNISSEDSQICANYRCQNTASPKEFPYCIKHRRKRSNSTSTIESTSPNLNENMSKLNIQNTPKRNSLNGRHENLSTTSRPCEEHRCSYYGLEEWGNRCSEHRQKGRASSLKRSSHSSGAEWHKCRSQERNCTGKGHSRYKGQCETCFLKQFDRQTASREDLSSMEILGMLPGKPSLGKHQAQVFYKCEFDDCKQMSTENTIGYCTDHFVYLYRQGRLDIPTQEIALEFRERMERAVKETREQGEICPSAKDKDDDYLCSEPCCEGIKCKNPEGKCFECNRKDTASKGKKLERQYSMEETEEARGEDLIESLSSSNDSDTCHAPGCLNKGKQSYKGLCLNCYFTLFHQIGQPSEGRRENPVRVQPILSSPSPSKRPTHRCKTIGCSMFGTEPNMGYCSLCFSKNKVKLEEQERLHRLRFMSEAERMRELPLDRTTLYPRPCITCDRPGHADYRGFCVVCAERRGMFCHGKPGVTSYPQRPARLATEHSTGGEMSGTLNSKKSAVEYQKVMQDVEKSSRTSHLKCKNTLCSNFANSSKDGYCNQCFIHYH